MILPLKVKKVSVFMRGGHTDKITLHLDHPTTFPEMGYPAYADIEARSGFGVRWCVEHLAIAESEIEVIKG